jgi:NTP pyrophosphatase (non-canonical NTP hydrolase)
MEKVIRDVVEERRRQDEKWGVQNHDPALWITILVEEVGEFSQAALEHRRAPTSPSRDQMREEAVQVAATALAIVELARAWGCSMKHNKIVCHVAVVSRDDEEIEEAVEAHGREGWTLRAACGHDVVVGKTKIVRTLVKLIFVRKERT